LERTRTIRQPDAVAIAFIVVLVPFLISSFFRRELYAHSAALYWLFDFAKFVILPAAALAILARRYAIRPRDYGMRGVAEHETWGHFLGLNIFLMLILNLVYHVTLYVTWLVLGPEVAQPFYHAINPTGWLRLPGTIYLSVTAGLVEEIFFRALPLLYLERRFGDAVPRKTYVLGTAILFAIIHWGNGPYEVVATFAFGVLAAILYLRLRDLWPLIGAHVIIDAIGFA
jgi:membrane protease YdiL (CAAX protease family)